MTNGVRYVGMSLLQPFLNLPLSTFDDRKAAKREGVAIDASGERELLIKAVRVNTLSKLTYSDTRQFLALIGDVFPGAESGDIPGVRGTGRSRCTCAL